MVDFNTQLLVRHSRKQHQCNGCREQIEIGSAYLRWTGVSDGYFASVAYHEDCREAEEKLNHENGIYGDEWYSLGDFLPDAMEFLKVDYPAVAERLTLKTREAGE